MFYPENFLRVLSKGATEHLQLLKLWDDVEAAYAEESVFAAPSVTPSIEWLKATDWYQYGGYRLVRAAAYPSLEDQADMAFHDRQDKTTTLDDALIAVKEKWGKPC